MDTPSVSTDRLEIIQRWKFILRLCETDNDSDFLSYECRQTSGYFSLSDASCSLISMFEKLFRCNPDKSAIITLKSDLFLSTSRYSEDPIAEYLFIPFTGALGVYIAWCVIFKYWIHLKQWAVGIGGNKLHELSLLMLKSVRNLYELKVDQKDN